MSLESTAKQVVINACRELMARPFDHGTIEWKEGEHNPVTSWDKTIEWQAREAFAPYNVNFRGEEFPYHNAGSNTTVIMDPIDGTKSFIRGQHGAAVSLAVMKDNEIAISAVGDFRMGLVYFAGENKEYIEHLWTGQRFTLRHHNDLDQTDVTTNYDHAVLLPALREAGYHTRQPTAIAVQLAQIAAGQIDAGIFNPGKGAIHDVAAGIGLIERVLAKGELKLSDIHGNPYDVTNPQRGLIVAPPEDHTKLVEIVRAYCKPKQYAA